MIFHRIVFYIGTVAVVLAFALGTDEVNTNAFVGAVYSTGGIYLFFYGYAILFALVDMVRKRRWRPLFVWFPVVILVPLIGVYLYFEKFIFPTYFRKKPLGEKPQEREEPVAFPVSAKALWHRAGATLFDFAVYFVFIVVYILTFGTPAGEGMWTIHGFHHQLIFCGVWFLYFPLSEALFGKTLGKVLLGMRVVMFHGGRPVTFGAALKRHLLDFIDLVILLGIVAITARKNAMPRRLGDYWAGTVVIPV